MQQQLCSQTACDCGQGLWLRMNHQVTGVGQGVVDRAFLRKRKVLHPRKSPIKYHTRNYLTFVKRTSITRRPEIGQSLRILVALYATVLVVHFTKLRATASRQILAAQNFCIKGATGFPSQTRYNYPRQRRLRSRFFSRKLDFSSLASSVTVVLHSVLSSQFSHFLPSSTSLVSQSLIHANDQRGLESNL